MCDGLIIMNGSWSSWLSVILSVVDSSAEDAADASLVGTTNPPPCNPDFNSMDTASLFLVGMKGRHMTFANRGINVQTDTTQDQGREPVGVTSGITRTTGRP